MSYAAALHLKYITTSEINLVPHQHRPYASCSLDRAVASTGGAGVVLHWNKTSAVLHGTTRNSTLRQSFLLYTPQP